MNMGYGVVHHCIGPSWYINPTMTFYTCLLTPLLFLHRPLLPIEKQLLLLHNRRPGPSYQLQPCMHLQSSSRSAFCFYFNDSPPKKGDHAVSFHVHQGTKLWMNDPALNVCLVIFFFCLSTHTLLTLYFGFWTLRCIYKVYDNN